VREAGRAASEAADRVERVREAGAAAEQPAEAGPLAHIDRTTTTTTTTARPRPAPTTTRPGDLPAPATTAPAPTGHEHGYHDITDDPDWTEEDWKELRQAIEATAAAS